MAQHGHEAAGLDAEVDPAQDLPLAAGIGEMHLFKFNNGHKYTSLQASH